MPSTLGNNAPRDRRPIADIYPPRTAVWVEAKEVSGTMSLGAGFDLLVLPNV